jgi:hypothetical protein
MSTVKLNVVAGQTRDVVGTIVPQPGMLTSAGVVARVSGSTVYFEGGAYRRSLGGVTVRHTEARKFGYPAAAGSERLKVRYIRRAGTRIAA